MFSPMGNWGDGIEGEEERKNALSNLGKPVSLKEILFRDQVSLRVWGFTQWQSPVTLEATLKVDYYKVLWQDNQSALVRVVFLPWKPEDNYEVRRRYELLTKTKKSDVVFVTRKSLVDFKDRPTKK